MWREREEKGQVEKEGGWEGSKAGGREYKSIGYYRIKVVFFLPTFTLS